MLCLICYKWNMLLAAFHKHSLMRCLYETHVECDASKLSSPYASLHIEPSIIERRLRRTSKAKQKCLSRRTFQLTLFYLSLWAALPIANFVKYKLQPRKRTSDYRLISILNRICCTHFKPSHRRLLLATIDFKMRHTRQIDHPTANHMPNLSLSILWLIEDFQIYRHRVRLRACLCESAHLDHRIVSMTSRHQIILLLFLSRFFYPPKTKRF